MPLTSLPPFSLPEQRSLRGSGVGREQGPHQQVQTHFQTMQQRGKSGSSDETSTSGMYRVRKTRAYYQRLFETAPDGILILDEETGQIIDANPYMADLLRHPIVDVIGKEVWELGLFRNPDAMKAAFSALRRTGIVHHEDLTLMARDGRRVDVEFICKVYDTNGHRFVQCNVRDISDRKYLVAELQRAATTDHLTGIANRRHFLTVARDELQRAHRYRRPLSLLILDVDHFKRINDSFGHPVGDDVLRGIAHACRGRMRSADVIGRLGGEEFGVLMPETAQRSAIEAAHRLQEAVASVAVQPPGKDLLTVTISIGIAITGAGQESLHALLARADAQLYRAKENGRNRIYADVAESVQLPDPGQVHTQPGEHHG